MLRTRLAEIRNDRAFTRKTVFLPKATATAPPKADPTARVTDQVVLESVLAASNSRPCAMLGTTAPRAGSKKAHMVVSAKRST